MLEVERELARVRLDIERLDAEKTNVGRRVSYATIGVTITEERKAGLDAGPLSLATRIRIAAADGLESALESVAADAALPAPRRPDARALGCGRSRGCLASVLRPSAECGLRDSGIQR